MESEHVPSISPPESTTQVRTLLTRSIALTVVAYDVTLPYLQTFFDFYALDRSLLVLVGLVAVLCLNHGHLPELGLTLVPVQSWRYWVRMGLWFGFWIALLLGLCGAVLIWYGWPIPSHHRPFDLNQLIFFCVRAPVEEELIYRSLLVVAIAPSCGKVGTILISGVIFAVIHVIGGNASPENQIAGFMLAWTFLKSRTILVPIAMHASGNLLAYASLVANSYWMP